MTKIRASTRTKSKTSKQTTSLCSSQDDSAAVCWQTFEGRLPGSSQTSRTASILRPFLPSCTFTWPLSQKRSPLAAFLGKSQMACRFSFQNWPNVFEFYRQGVMESFLGHMIAGGVFCLFGGQPLTVLGCTGPVSFHPRILLILGLEHLFFSPKPLNVFSSFAYFMFLPRCSSSRRSLSSSATVMVS